MDGDEVKRPVTPEELEIAFEGPAPGCNRFTASMGATGLRVAFIEESPNGRSWFRSAVTMHPVDGLKLAQMLTEMLADVKAQIDALSEQKEP